MPRIPQSCYIHVPFCRHRCGYCNFTLVAGRDDLIDTFLSALEVELATVLPGKQRIQTLFLGGGTPTHLSPRKLERLLSILAAWFEVVPGGEYSCEANPLDCTCERLEILAAGGVNRISIGGQSFNDSKLKLLERDHTGSQLQESLERSSEWVKNLSLDLIFAAPRETLEDWQLDVGRALSCPIEHLSTYGLTIERGSRFYGRMLRGNLVETEEGTQLAMFEYAIDTLLSHGWQHYEVSNFAREGKECQHNEAYWLGKPWWGFGPGAASFLPSEDGSTFVRAVNHRSTVRYLQLLREQRSPIAEREVLTRQQMCRERLVFGLRRMHGIDWHDLRQEFGTDVRTLFEPSLSEFLSQGLLESTADRIRLTRKGLVVSDSLWPHLLE